MTVHGTDNRRAAVVARLDKLSPAKRALIEARLNAERPSAGLNPITPLPDDSPVPLSCPQNRLWFLENLEGATGAYNVVRGWWLEGPLNVERLRRTMQSLVARHQSFRTEFLSVRDQPRQRVRPEIDFQLPLVDLRSEPAAERRALAMQIADADAVRSFDLGQAPLMRASLVRVENDCYLLVLVMHHIICDGWSIGVFARDLNLLYADAETELPALTIHYPDYAAWQHRLLKDDKLQDQIAYWREQLSALPALALPTDRRRPQTRSHKGEIHEFSLSPELRERLERLGQQFDVTLYMLLLAAFQVLLARYSGQDDFAVSSPIAGRSLAELEDLIGFFLNSLVMRADTTGDPRFSELLDRVKATALDAYAHCDLPYEKLVEELNPTRDLSRTPLIQVMFALQNVPEGEVVLPGIQVRREDAKTGTAKFDLTLMLYERESGLLGRLEYATDLFDQATIVRLGRQYACLLEAVVREPDCRLSRLPLLHEAESQQLIKEWNETTTNYPSEACIHQLFERQAATTPKATAIVHGGTELSYAQLNARANRLAHHLVELGVGADGLVGVCLERSIEMVVAMLAVLKAGGAYVPLDPEYPERRLADMLADAAPGVLLTQRDLAPGLPAYDGPILCLDAFDDEAQGNESNVERDVAADNLAYVIYTSGSTGRPKGTCIEHRSVVRLVVDTDYVKLGPANVMGQISSCSFDAATFEIWGALLNGAQLVVIDKAIALSPPSLAKTIEHHDITTLFLTTALFNLLAEVTPATLGRLQHLLFGGEMATPKWVRQLLLTAPPKHLLHVYGPTETTTFASWYEVTGVAADAETVPIGRPLANTTLYVLDKHQQPLPIGVPGELYIGGDGVARGYLNQSALTASQFIENPFGTGRLYRSGDRVRYLADGNIEFLGRVDHQVKLRGYRIELGEIELALAEHPAVKAAVVILREDSPGDKQLAGYIVTEDDAGDVREILQQQLKARLPRHMIPAALMTLPEFPLSANGKLDRDALPSPGKSDVLTQNAYIAPRTPLEQTLSKLWQDLLNLEQVGINDSFFDLGGHSLLAVRLFSEIEKATGKRPPLATLFHAPTIQHLAGELEKESWNDYYSSVVAIQAQGTNQPLFGVPGVGGNVICFAELAKRLGNEQPVYGLQSVGLDGKTSPLATIPAIAEQNLREIRQIQSHGPYYLMGACVGAVVAFEMARQLVAHGEEVALLAMLDPSPPNLDASTGTPEANPEKPPSVLRFVLRQAHKNWQTFVNLESRERWVYLKNRLQVAAEIILKRDVFRGDRSHFHESSVVDATTAALKTYVPDFYQGSASLILAKDRKIRGGRNKRLDWHQLIGGELPVHEIPGKDSGHMLLKANVSPLADLLLNEIERLERQSES